MSLEKPYSREKQKAEQLEDAILKKALVISFEKLNEEPYASIICYPKTSKATLKNRLKELQKLGVKALGLTEEKEAFNISVCSSSQ